MEFKDFLEKEEAELFDAGLEQFDEVLGTALKFAGGLGGNLISQTIRGAGNAVSGVAQGLLGTGQTALAGLQAAGGGSKQGKETLKKGLSNLGGAGSSLARGVGQLTGALTGVTPVLRGAQAASEPMSISGVYAPASKNRSSIQDIFGLNSWEKEKPQPQQSQPQQSQPQQSQPQQSQPQQSQPQQSRQLNPKQQQILKTWNELISAYKSARTSEERKEIRRKMRAFSPRLYQRAVEKGAAMMANKKV